MADVFISFKTDDTPRVQAVHDGFRARGLTVFWSNDIPKGAPNYQAVIKDEILKAPVVVVVWTNGSVHSGPVVQECSQAEKASKLFQILFDDIEPIDMPMEVKYKSQKTKLVGWTGDSGNVEWTRLNDAIDARLGRRPGAIPVEVGMPGRSQQRYFLPGDGRNEWFRDHEHGPEMVVVPAGHFTMGSPDDEPERIGKGHQHAGIYGIEEPRRTVTIARPFAVGRCAVTIDEFAAFVAATGHKMPDSMYTFEDEKLEERAGRSWRNPGFAQTGRHPVVGINWDDAKAYVGWLAKATGKPYRLLSEAEREYVCRAGFATPFWWGKAITPAEANYDGNYTYAGGGSKGAYRKATLPVDYAGEKFRPNPWGLHQVHGNVWEWCEDVWHQSYDGAPVDGTAWIRGGDASRRVLRGGSWSYGPWFLRSAYRSRYTSDLRYYDFGFRLGRTL